MFVAMFVAVRPHKLLIKLLGLVLFGYRFSDIFSETGQVPSSGVSPAVSVLMFSKIAHYEIMAVSEFWGFLQVVFKWEETCVSQSASATARHLLRVLIARTVIFTAAMFIPIIASVVSEEARVTMMPATLIIVLLAFAQLYFVTSVSLAFLRLPF